MAAAGTSREKLSKIKSWFILLGYDPARTEVPNETVSKFEMAILDPDSHPPLSPLREKMILLSYLSLGEASTYRSYWDRIKDKPWVLHENKDWKDSYRVDVRSEEWGTIVLDEAIPGILEQGFQGLMLDTLDAAAFLEETAPEKFKGVKQAMADLVKAIHEKYPQLLLVSNNGFGILNEIAPVLDGLLAEDIHWMIDFEKQKYREVPKTDREYRINLLKGTAKAYSLPVFNIDYVSQKDRRLIKKCIKKSKKLGFKPYVAEKDLSEIYRQG